MSLLSPEQWYLSLSPEGVAVLRRTPGSSRARERAWLPCPARAPDEPAWAPALSVLRQWAATVAEQRPRKATVVLSNHFLRYVLVPWNDAVATEEEELAHARHCFASIHGAGAERWSIRLSPGGWQRPGIASALDAGLIEALEQTLAAARIRLASVQPYLMAAFNRSYRRLGGPATWFLLAEPGKLCLARLEEGHWSSLDTLRADAGWLQDLGPMLEREYLVRGLAQDSAEIYLFATDAAAAPVEIGPWRLHTLPPPTLKGLPDDEARPFQLALCG